MEGDPESANPPGRHTDREGAGAGRACNLAMNGTQHHRSE
jgi:hypothetical protein